jgi:hypothetical protein
MQYSNSTSVGHAAEWLSAKTGERWTTAQVIERLIEIGPDRIGVMLPPGWALIRTADGERVHFPRARALEVGAAIDFLEQFAMFADLSIAVGVPAQLSAADGTSYRSAAPIPAAMIRIAPGLLSALPRGGGSPIASFLELATRLAPQRERRPGGAPPTRR